MPVKQRHEKNEVSDNLVSYLYNLTNTLSMNITSSMGITEGFFFFFFTAKDNYILDKEGLLQCFFG